jgi:hypothetical protein
VLQVFLGCLYFCPHDDRPLRTILFHKLFPWKNVMLAPQYQIVNWTLQPRLHPIYTAGIRYLLAMKFTMTSANTMNRLIRALGRGLLSL